MNANDIIKGVYIEFRNDTTEFIMFPSEAYYQKDSNAFVVEEIIDGNANIYIYPREEVRRFKIEYEGSRSGGING